MVHVTRRELITLLGGAAVWPLAARAQQPERMRRIGVLMLYEESDPAGQGRAMAFRQGLETLGWTIGRNVRIDIRWARANPHAGGPAETAGGLLGTLPRRCRRPDVLWA
jgi:hypothetical protein